MPDRFQGQSIIKNFLLKNIAEYGIIENVLILKRIGLVLISLRFALESIEGGCVV